LDEPALGERFNQGAQNIIDALGLDCASAKPQGKTGKVQRHADGKVKMEFTAPHGPNDIIEVSTNTVFGAAIEAG